MNIMSLVYYYILLRDEYENSTRLTMKCSLSEYIIKDEIFAIELIEFIQEEGRTKLFWYQEHLSAQLC